MKALILGLILSGSFQALAATSESTATLPPSAADVAPSHFHLTPFFGVAGSKITTNQGDIEGDSTASTGGLAEFGSGYVTFQTGLAFTQAGGKGTYNQNDATLRLSYLSVPIFAKVNIMGTPRRTVYIKTGLMPGALVSKEIQVKSQSGSLTGSTSDFTAGSFDLPAVFGVGGAIPVYSKGSIIVEMNFSRSLNDYKLLSDTIKAKNESLTILVGMSFAL